MATATLRDVAIRAGVSRSAVSRTSDKVGISVSGADFVSGNRSLGKIVSPSSVPIACTSRSLACCHARSSIQCCTPNCCLSFASLRICVAAAIIAESTLSFLGLGIQPPYADLGGMVRENAAAINFGMMAPIYPATAIALLTVSVNLVVDWMLSIDARPSGAQAEL